MGVDAPGLGALKSQHPKTNREGEGVGFERVGGSKIVGLHLDSGLYTGIRVWARPAQKASGRTEGGVCKGSNVRVGGGVRRAGSRYGSGPRRGAETILKRR